MRHISIRRTYLLYCRHCRYCTVSYRTVPYRTCKIHGRGSCARACISLPPASMPKGYFSPEPFALHGLHRNRVVKAPARRGRKKKGARFGSRMDSGLAVIYRHLPSFTVNQPRMYRTVTSRRRTARKGPRQEHREKVGHHGKSIELLMADQHGDCASTEERLQRSVADRGC